MKYTVRLEKAQPSGEFSRSLEFVCFHLDVVHETVIKCIQTVASDTSGRLYIIKIFDDRSEYYRQLNLDCHLQLTDMCNFLIDL